VSLQRKGVAAHAPDTLSLWDALVAATRDVARSNAGARSEATGDAVTEP
jgi:hypothetical protein